MRLLNQSSSWGTPAIKKEIVSEPLSPATPPGDDATSNGRKRRKAAVKATVRVKKQLGTLNKVKEED